MFARRMDGYQRRDQAARVDALRDGTGDVTEPVAVRFTIATNP